MALHLSIGHEYHAFVTLRSTHMGQANAGVPSSAFDDRSTGSYAGTPASAPVSLQQATASIHSPTLFFCVSNDPNGGTVLDASPRILKLGLAEYVTSCLFRQRFEIYLCVWSKCISESSNGSPTVIAHQRGVSHCVGEALDGGSNPSPASLKPVRVSESASCA